MEQRQKILKYGACAIAFAVALRLLGGAMGMIQALPEDPGLLSLAVFLQTGRYVRFPHIEVTPTTPTEPPETTAPAETEPTPTQPDKPTFTADDLEEISVIYGCDYRPDLEELLLSDLQWDLTDGEPAVLIVHTHATECYEKTEGEDFDLSGSYRTLDDRYNMVSIGDEVARILEEGGITVIHDRTFHDYPDYNYSYINTRKSIQSWLEQYPTIRMVLDIHRDASSESSENQLVTSATVGGQKSAQLMMVIGTDASGNHHPNWQENLALALKLTAQLEQTDPGITRPIYLRSERFNMDMTTGSLLVEVGAAGNTHQEAILAANALARAVLILAKGTQ